MATFTPFHAQKAYFCVDRFLGAQLSPILETRSIWLTVWFSIQSWDHEKCTRILDMEYDPPVTETKVRHCIHTLRGRERGREGGRQGFVEGRHALLSSHPTRELLEEQIYGRGVSWTVRRHDCEALEETVFQGVESHDRVEKCVCQNQSCFQALNLTSDASVTHRRICVCSIVNMFNLFVCGGAATV